MVLNIEICIPIIYKNVHIKESSSFIMLEKLTQYVTIHYPRMMKGNVKRNVKVILYHHNYKGQTSDFVHIVVKSNGQPEHTHTHL